MTNQYNKVVSVVSKCPSQRTDKDALSITAWFKKKSRLFRDIHGDAVCDIIKNCEFTSQLKDDVLIRQGEVGNNFYILLRGAVSIYIQGAGQDGEELNGQELFTEQQEEEEKDILEELHDRHRQVLDRSKYGNFIVQLEEGQSFGELALINKDCIRNASIIVDCHSDLLVVERKLYNRCLKAAQTADFEQRNAFVSSSPLFKWWSARYKRQMAYSIVKETISFHEYMFRQGQHADKLYFILSGQAKILQNPTRHLQQYAALYQEHEEALEEADTRLSNKYKIAQTVERRPRTAPSSRRKQLPIPDFEICLVGENEILGAGEFIMGLKTYYRSVQATETCVAYSLEQKHYERLIVRKHPSTLGIIERAVCARLHNRVMRMPEEHTSLFRLILHKLQRKEESGQQESPLVMAASKRSSHHWDTGGTTAAPPPRFCLRPPPIRDKSPRQSSIVMRAAHIRNFGGQNIRDLHEPTDQLQGHRCEPAEANAPTQSTIPVMNVDQQQEEGEKSEEDLADRSVHVNKNNSTSSQIQSAEVSRAVTRDDVSRRSSPQSPATAAFYDWPSSDHVLADLESRLQDWLYDVAADLGMSGRGQPHPVAMRRVNIQRGIAPKPGSTVVFTRKGTSGTHHGTFPSSSAHSSSGRSRPRTSPSHKIGNNNGKMSLGISSSHDFLSRPRSQDQRTGRGKRSEPSWI